MICDETITGFGRTGEWWACDHWRVAPDIVTFAKGVTSGITPFSGLTVSGPVADVFMAAPDGFPFGHTFSGNPLGCAVAAESIRVLRDERLIERAAVAGERMRAGLEQIAAASDHVGQVRGRGLLLGVELVTDPQTCRPLAGGSAALTAAARERDLLVYSCPTPLNDLVVESVLLAPPLVTSDADLDEMVGRFAESVAMLGRR